MHEQFVKMQLHAGGKSRVTIKNYRDNFALLLEFKPDIILSDLTEKTIVDFFEWLNSRTRTVGKSQVVRNYKNSSVATVRSKLNTFFVWLGKHGKLDKNPFKEIPHPIVEYTDNRAFTAEEFDRICSAVNTKIAWTNLLIKKRNIAMVMFLALTGVRKNEMINLTLADVDLKNKLITVRGETSKSKRTRTITLSSELIPYLKDYLKYRVDDYATTALWVSGNSDRPLSIEGMKHFTGHLTKATGINCYLHRFRHTFAVNYYLKTRDLLGLKQLLGHKSFKMTMGYLRSLSNDPTVQAIQEMTTREFM